ncbi:MAG: hypothetical protein JNK81_00795 [Anaerolineales bacterium]|nr:hypothetical protein [Anaerolineales bacterium]
MTKIILLDIDGVLVTPGGYRAALHSTLNHFATLMGSPHFDFHEEHIADLERRGIFSEWDMVPILLATAWNDILSTWNEINLPADVTSAAIEIGKRTNGYISHGIKVPKFEILPNIYPTESALQQKCFPFIPENLRQSLLHDSRNVHFSATTRLFQHFSLGSKTFSKAYNLPPEIETESLLHSHDVANLTPSILNKLIQPNIYLASITARPSAPPRNVDTSHIGYAPEAEKALELVGLPNIPLIGYGRLEYIAKLQNLEPSTLLKPSPIHALAGTLAAYTNDEWGALQAAVDWQQTGKLNNVFSLLPNSFELIVVEDTMGGIRSVQSAGEIFQKAGFDVNIKTIGLISGSKAKALAFEKARIQYFDTWEEIITNIEI